MTDRPRIAKIKRVIHGAFLLTLACLTGCGPGLRTAGPGGIVPMAPRRVRSVRVGEATVFAVPAPSRGLPADRSRMAARWAKVSGPGDVAFSEPMAPRTSARFSLPGDYVVRATVTGGRPLARYDLEVRVVGKFAFACAADMRRYAGPGAYDSPKHFRGACEAIAALGCDLMVVGGDLDPPEGAAWTIEQVLGEDFPWYPVVGNHDIDKTSRGRRGHLRYLRRMNRGGHTLPYLVRSGPEGGRETTYSFDYGDCHFVVLNQYLRGRDDAAADGDVSDELHAWLAEELAATDRSHIFVFGHEPAYPQPDMDGGSTRHASNCLNKYPARRDRFWQLLWTHGVRAYVCGHTHCYSAHPIRGVWQIDVGHARGKGGGARSTFVRFEVDGPRVTFVTHRDDGQGGRYTPAHQGTLAPAPTAGP
jgi:hypothetical protein